MLGDEFAVDLEIGSGGADVAGGAGPFALVGEELKLDADGESLLESHALRWLGVHHHAAVEIHVARGIGHHLAGEFVFHPEDVVGVGQVGIEVAETFIEPGVFVVFAFEDAVFDPEGIEGVFANRMAGNFGSPTGEILAVEKGHPIGGMQGQKEKG